MSARLSRTQGALLGLLLSFVSATPALAQGGGAVVLVPLEGRGANQVERQLRAGLEAEGFTLLDAPNADAAPEIAREGGATAILGGTSAGRASARRVDLWVRDREGEPQGEARVILRRRGGASALVRAARGLIEGVGQAGAAEPTSPSERPGSSTAPEAETSTGTDTGTDTSTSTSTSTSTNAGTGTGTSTSTSTDTSSREPAPILRIEGLAGAGIRSRSFTLLRPDGRGVAYDAPLFAELRVDAALWLFDIVFLRGRFGSSLGLETRLDEGNRGDALYVRAGAEVGARVDLDPVELSASFGVHWDRYEQPFDERLPTADYLSLRPAITTGFRFGDWVRLDGELGARFGLGAGDLESIYGVDRRVFGLDATLRLRVETDFGLRFALEGSFVRYWLRFRGPGGSTRAADEGLSTALLVGYGWP